MKIKFGLYTPCHQSTGRKIVKTLSLWAMSCVLLGGALGCASAAEPDGGAGEQANGTRLACIGDSITYGAGVSDRATKTYPVLLENWLGAGWNVRNFGASGSTLLKKGNLPYWKRPQFRQALAFKPDVAVFLFGANDSKHGDPNNTKVADNWQYKADFAADYKALLAEFRKANPNVKIYLGLPVPAFAPNRYGIDGTVIEKEIVPLVREVATESKAEVIDLHGALTGPAQFHDRVHPNDEGTRLMATTVYRALTGKEPPSDSALPAATGATIPNSPQSVANAPAAVTAPVASPQNAAAPPASPAPVVVTPPAKESFAIYLLMGQSNMVGRDTRTLASQVDNPRILSLNGDGQWVVARDPIHPQVGRIPGGVGPGIPFAAEMLKANPNVTIGLVPCAVGGTPLRRWVKGGDLYENAVKRAKLAAPAGVIKGVLWHQGETDSDKKTDAETYEARLTQMFKDLRQDLGTPNLPIVVGQLGDFLTPDKHPYVDTVRAAIKHIPTVVPNVGYADSSGLGHKGDTLHFSGEAQKEMGAHFAQAMQGLQKAQ